MKISNIRPRLEATKEKLVSTAGAEKVFPEPIWETPTFKEETFRSGSDDRERSKLGMEAPISEAACCTSITFCSGVFFNIKYTPPLITKTAVKTIAIKPAEPLTKNLFLFIYLYN